MEKIKIIDPIEGQILNYHDACPPRLVREGREAEEGLSILVKGIAPEGAVVLVNGVRAERKGTEFSASILIKEREEIIEAKIQNSDISDKITVLWDKNSVKRYRFSLDDNIWFLRDIARNNYKSIFDNPYLGLWKRLHDKYGTKFGCNIYYQCPAGPGVGGGEAFDLSMMPDKYKGEWKDNSDWFRLTFHALQDEPPKPYLNATYEQMAKDYDAVMEEIFRFAGEEVTDTFTTIHWGEAPVEACRALRDRGIKGLVGYFEFQNGKPSVSYYLPEDIVRHINKRDYWKDIKEDIIFVKHDIVVNSFRLDEIVPHLENVAKNPHQEEVMELIIHEQYFYPDYPAYQPDYAQKCETAIKWVTEKGYKPVFYSEGFIGSPDE